MAIEAVVNDDTVRRQSRRATESQRDPRHPDENEKEINGCSQYTIYADRFFRNSVTPSVACGATFPYTTVDGFVLSYRLGAQSSFILADFPLKVHGILWG